MQRAAWLVVGPQRSPLAAGWLPFGRSATFEAQFFLEPRRTLNVHRICHHLAARIRPLTRPPWPPTAVKCLFDAFDKLRTDDEILEQKNRVRESGGCHPC